MKKLSAILLFTVFIGGCSESNDEETPRSFNRILLTEECNGSSSYNIKKVEEYRYVDGWMTGHSITQQFIAPGANPEESSRVSFVYAGDRNSVTLTDEVGTKRTYFLNADGYATDCRYESYEQRRHYTFSYAGGYLIRLTEELFPTKSSENGTLFHSLDLTYSEDNLTSVTSSSFRNSPTAPTNQFRTIYEAGKEKNIYAIPCLELLDTYPLSFHQQALFAGMLGKMSQHFTARSYPEQTAGKYSESTAYIYELNSQQKPTAIRKRMTYTGGEDRDLYPNRRDITVTIE